MQKKPTPRGKVNSTNYSEKDLVSFVEKSLNHPNKQYLASLIAARVPKDLLLRGLLGGVPKNLFHKEQSILVRASALSSWKIDIPYSIKAGFMINNTYIYGEVQSFDPTSVTPYSIFYRFKDDKNETLDDTYATAAHSLLILDGEEWMDDIEITNIKADEIEY